MTNSSNSAFPRFLPAGTSGLVVEFGLTVDERLNDRVLALDQAIADRPIEGVQEVVPTYRSLLIHFDPTAIGRQMLTERVRALLEAAGAKAKDGRLWRVPVRYGGECGEDLESVAALHGLTPDEVVALHAGSDFRVYMIGFAPGFAYLGGLDERIHTGRRTEPRLKTPARSISIGGAQSAINPPLELPSGWHMLGQTPVRSYDPARQDEPFLFRAGDRIRFHPIEDDEYDALCAAAEAGEIVAELETDGEAGS